MAVASQKLYNLSVLGVNHLHKPVHGHSNTVLWKKGGPAGFCPDTEGANQACQLDGDWLVWLKSPKPSEFQGHFSKYRPEIFGLYISRFLMGFEEFEQ